MKWNFKGNKTCSSRTELYFCEGETTGTPSYTRPGSSPLFRMPAAEDSSRFQSSFGFLQEGEVNSWARRHSGKTSTHAPILGISGRDQAFRLGLCLLGVLSFFRSVGVLKLSCYGSVTTCERYF